jgi:hypothetical protein
MLPHKSRCCRNTSVSPCANSRSRNHSHDDQAARGVSVVLRGGKARKGGHVTETNEHSDGSSRMILSKASLLTDIEGGRIFHGNERGNTLIPSAYGCEKNNANGLLCGAVLR